MAWLKPNQGLQLFPTKSRPNKAGGGLMIEPYQSGALCAGFVDDNVATATTGLSNCYSVVEMEPGCHGCVVAGNCPDADGAQRAT